MRHSALLLAALVALPAQAEITMPAGAALRLDEAAASGAYALPIGAHDGDTLPVVRTEGVITRQAWRLGGSGQSSYQIILGLKQQLIGDGYDILFECDQTSCGGYDFRFDTEVIREPDMHVDLGDYQFLSAHVPGDSGRFASLLVSRSASAGFVQLIQVTPSGVKPDGTVTAPLTPPVGSSTPPAVLGEVGAAMEDIGRFVLSDLRFETGSSALGEGQYDSLADLSGYLKSNPNRRVALVGHTDAEGSLAANIAISKRRATSVLDRLVTLYGVPAAQLEAEGIGYLAPLSSNQTENGRTLNRRVEAILVSTQ